MEMASLKEGEWSCYRSGHFNGEENGHVTEVVTNGGRMVMLQRWSLMEGEWLSYGGGQFNRRENGYVTEVVSLMEGKWSGYRWPVYWKENGHVTEVVSSIEG